MNYRLNGKKIYLYLAFKQIITNSCIMKILFSILSVCLISLSGFSNYTELFSYNEQSLEKEMQMLQEIEDYIHLNPGTTYSQLEVCNPSMICNLASDDDPTAPAGSVQPPLGIPSFYWGCCFGLSGVLIVALVTEDKEEIHKSLRGCTISAITYSVIVAIYFIIILAYGGTLFYYY